MSAATEALRTGAARAPALPGRSSSAGPGSGAGAVPARTHEVSLLPRHPAGTARAASGGRGRAPGKAWGARAGREARHCCPATASITAAEGLEEERNAGFICFR